MVENLFIIFAPGTGGNHLANLISLSKKFNRQVDFSQYGSGQKDAHFSDVVTNLDVTVTDSKLRQLVLQNNVFCGHIGQYIWFAQHGLSDLFPNKKFILINVPEPDTTAFNRAATVVPIYRHNYSYHETKTLYSIKCLSALFNEHDWFQINAEDIFQPNADLILTFIKNELWLDVDIEYVKTIHSKWFLDVTTND